MKNTKEFFKSIDVSKQFKILIALIAILLIFSAGMFVGYHKAKFAGEWSCGYGKQWNDPRSMFAPFMHDSDDMNPHGAIGQIISINGSELMVKNPFEAEKVISIGSSTIIHTMNGDGTSTDLIPGNHVLIIGIPDEQGQIQATFIRIVPEPIAGSSTSNKPPKK